MSACFRYWEEQKKGGEVNTRTTGAIPPGQMDINTASDPRFYLSCICKPHLEENGSITRSWVDQVGAPGSFTRQWSFPKWKKRETEIRNSTAVHRKAQGLCHPSVGVDSTAQKTVPFRNQPTTPLNLRPSAPQNKSPNLSSSLRMWVKLTLTGSGMRQSLAQSTLGCSNRILKTR